MRIQDIMNLGKQYLILGFVLVLLLGVIFYIRYLRVFKRLPKREKKKGILGLCWCAVLICYLVVVIGVTILSRSNAYRSGGIVSFFYSYKEAWISASVSAWRNIILNILMFVPLGFLLPIGIKRFEVFWKTYLVGFLLTVFIELIQLVFARGIFEVADIFNNLIGTMIGFGCYRIVMLVVTLIQNKKPKWISTLILQVPFIIAIILFMAIYIVYQNQELGNLRCEYVEAYDKDKINVTTNEVYSEEENIVPVYRVPVISTEESRQIAENFFQRMGTKLDENRVDLYEETAFYYAKDSIHMMIDYLGGTYSVTDFDTVFSHDESGNQQIHEVKNADEAMIREALELYGITVLEEAEFNYSDETNYQFSLNQVIQNDVMYHGTLSCTYYDNGKLGKINNNMIECRAYKEFGIISEQEASERIKEGKFGYYTNEPLDIMLGEVTLDYMVDSKGFFQPIYKFKVILNGHDTVIMIPALNS